MALGQPNGNRGGGEEQIWDEQRRQALHSVRIALRRLQDYQDAGALITPRDCSSLATVLMRALQCLHFESTEDRRRDYYG